MPFTFLAIVVLLLFPSTAFAGYHDICGYTNFNDSRTRLSNLSGSRVKSPSLGLGLTQRAKRVKLYLFDEDGGCQDHEPSCGQSDDDLLATTYTNATTGYFCFYDIGNLEDAYIKTRYESDDAEVRDSSGALISASTHTVDDFGNVGAAGNSDGGDMILNWNISCPQNADWQGYCFWPLTPFESFAAILQSAVDVDVLITDDNDFHPNGHSGKIVLYYPDDPGNDCDGDDTRSISCNEICIQSSSAFNNHSVYHEIGHNLHKRTLDHCSSLGDGACYGPTGWVTWEGEKCATSEGFADFVALATAFWPWEDEAYYQTSTWNAEGSTTAANGQSQSPSRCVNMASNPHRRRGNVARFFWDLYDTTTIFDTLSGGYSDDASWSFHSILTTWDYFPAGTGNRKRNESSDFGRNAYDYAHYAPSAESELNVNCLDAQQN